MTSSYSIQTVVYTLYRCLCYYYSVSVPILFVFPRIRIIRLYKQWTTHRGLCTPFDYKSFFVCFFTDIGEDAGLEIDWPARLARFPVSLSSSLSVAMQFLHLYSIYAARCVLYPLIHRPPNFSLYPTVQHLVID